MSRPDAPFQRQGRSIGSWAAPLPRIGNRERLSSTQSRPNVSRRQQRELGGGDGTFGTGFEIARLTGCDARGKVAARSRGDDHDGADHDTACGFEAQQITRNAKLQTAGIGCRGKAQRARRCDRLPQAVCKLFSKLVVRLDIETDLR